jgi:hypothetical protein
MTLTWQDWATVVGLAVGLLGLAVAFWQWRSQRNESEPYYRLTSHRIIGPFDPNSPFAAIPGVDLALMYRQEKIDAANRAFLAFWNHSKRTLDGESLLIEDPLRVEVAGDAFFLGEPRVLSTTREAIRFEASRDTGARGKIFLRFAFLAHDDGALVEFLFTGPSQDIALKGDLKSGRKPRRDGDLTLKVGRSKRDSAIARMVSFSRGMRQNKELNLFMVFNGSFLWFLLSLAGGWSFLLGFPVTIVGIFAIGLYLSVLAESGTLPSVGRRNRRLPRALRTYHIPESGAPRNFRALLAWIWAESGRHN